MPHKAVITIYSILCVVALGALVTGYVGNRKVRSAQKCTGIEVSVLDSTTYKFMDSKEVVALIDRDFGGYVNRPRDSVKLSKVEKVLAGQGFLEQHEAWFDNEGILHIEVRQCLPLAKRTDGANISYMDRRGKFYPVRGDWFDGLPSVNGQTSMNDLSWNDRFGSLAAWVAGNVYWKGKVNRYNCFPDGEISVNLAGRDEDFIIGQPVQVRRKFERILKYCEDIAPRVKRDSAYNSVNVNFDKQIVCR